MKFKYFLSACVFSILMDAQTVENIDQLSDRVRIHLSDGILSIIPMAEDAVRIKYFKEVEPDVPEIIFTSSISIPDFKVSDSSSKLEVELDKMIVVMEKQTGKLSFANSEGKVFLNEKENRKLIASSVHGKPCFITEQSYESPNDEYIFGLGQFQDGHYNLKNITRRLTQVNSQISLPFIYSSKGYGLLWHQYGLTDFNPTDNSITLAKQEHSTEGDKQEAEVTTTSGTQKVPQHQSLYKGQFNIPADAIYSIFLDLGDMDNRQYVVIDGKPIIDFSNFWLPPTVSELVELKAGGHEIQVVCKSTNTPNVSWKLANALTTFRSREAKLLDYVVFYGPSADNVIVSYRNLSGNVPMLPKWAYGFWQCRERYKTSEELVNVVKEFRKRNLPIDVIVQDWQYWGDRGWGVPQLDKTRYPNPEEFINEIHGLNAHFNISIWSNPDKNSEIGKEYVKENLFIPDTKWLDYFNPVTGKKYWNTLKVNLFVYGVDSWWMDATEPENDALDGEETFLGLGNYYRLTYPLYVSQSVYEGQRETTSDKRVCILTRSAFLGQQRYGTTNWSGDIGGTWDSFKRQIVAGLNYTITGMPYWTTDIGGFFRPGQSQYSDENFRELLIRWFQWGAFNPIYRNHGYQSETEPWKYGEQVENNVKKISYLRYRLLPYIYSEAWQITNNGSTMMRPLVMDYNRDTDALNQPYEYMFGKAFLVAPVIEPNVKKWKVYLPESVDWYDFWTSEKLDGGQTINTAVSIDKIPLFVKEGSIVPMGPEIQYATEKNDPVEIRIYTGTDGEFTFYEDENDNYNYEKGMYSIITFKWNNENNELTISDRNGSFSGMLKERKFRIIKISENRSPKIAGEKEFDKEVIYKGNEVSINL
jgi:alpha-D-xyloside xylohydrolase